ncbi:MAG: M1 family peptidase, partial [Flavobacterium macrobrachii]
MKKTLLFLFLLITNIVTAQETFTRKDSLHGGLRFERTCFDVLHYGLNITVKPDEKYISGSNFIIFKVVENTKKIQLDLFENMKVDSIFIGTVGVENDVIFEGEYIKLNYTREYNAVFIDFPEELKKGSTEFLEFYYSGKPLEANNAPWDGGFVWKKDKNGKPFVGVAVQGVGASLWYPCKDSQSDEPENGA